MIFFHTLIVITFLIFARVNCQSLDFDAIQAHLEQMKTSLNSDGKVISFEEKCRINGAGYIGSEEYQITKLKSCLTEYLTSSMSQEYITQETLESPRARIKLMCKYEPGAHECFNEYANTLKSCMNQTEKDESDIFWKIVYKSFEYICYRKGDRIATFIENGGPQCLEERSEGLTNCLMITLNKYVLEEEVENDTRHNESLPTLKIITARECKIISGFKTCVHDELIQCSNDSPASIVDDFIQFLEVQLTCRNNASTTTWNFVLLGLAALLSLFKSKQ